MKDFVSFFLLLIIGTILYIYLETKSLDVKYVKSNIDNREYLVRNLPDSQEASDLLAEIHSNNKKLIEVVNTEANQKEYTKQNLIDIERLTKNYRNGNISESNPGNKYTSYSINKGEKIVFCIRSKNGSNKLEPLNTMLFVSIHELAHLMTKSIGHNEEFWNNMRFLLKEAIKANIYTQEDYMNNPVDYCGTVINDSPLK